MSSTNLTPSARQTLTDAAAAWRKVRYATVETYGRCCLPFESGPPFRIFLERVDTGSDGATRRCAQSSSWRIAWRKILPKTC